jgi:hypothetical protein
VRTDVCALKCSNRPTTDLHACFLLNFFSVLLSGMQRKYDNFSAIQQGKQTTRNAQGPVRRILESVWVVLSCGRTRNPVGLGFERSFVDRSAIGRFLDYG